MTEIKIQPSETHEGRQRTNLVSALYGLIVIGITCWLVFSEALFVPDIIDMVTGSDNKYYPKLVFVIVLLIVGLVLFPVFWLAKKIVAKKNQSEMSSLPLESSGAGKKEFSFSYGPAVNTIILDDMFVQVKMGFAKRTFQVSRLRNFYLLNKKTYSTLYISYEDENGKIRNCPMNAEAGNQQVQLLAAELAKRFPGKSLNNVSQKEAFKIMKVMNPALIAVIILVVIAVATAGIVIFAVME